MDSSDDIPGSSNAGVAPVVMSSAPSTIPIPPVSASVATTAPTALSRSVSQHSATSTRSHRSMRGHGRGSSRRGSSHVALPGTSSSSVTSEDSKSLTSFPSFSPKAKSPPSPTRASSRTRTSGPAASSASLIQSLLASQQQQQPQQPTPSSLLPKAGATASSTASFSSVPALSAPRSALFEDTLLLPSSKLVPSALHLADDAHIARLIGENGAVALVRQLAEDLAKRDAQMEVLRQRADDRERLLRKIILECGLTNLDLETRLRTLEQEQEARRAARREAEAAAAASDPDTTANALAASRRRVSDLVSDALADDNSIHQDSGDYYYNSSTIRASNGKSTDAGASGGASGTTKGWKDFLWGGGTTKKNSGTSTATPRTVKRIPLRSGSGDRRLPVTEDLFQPPLPIDPQPDYDYDANKQSSASSARGATESAAAPAPAPAPASETGASGEAQSGSASGRKGSLATQALRLFVSGSANSNGSSNNESAPLPGTGGSIPGTAKARNDGRNSTASSAASLRTASSGNARTPISAAVARASRASISQGSSQRASLMSMRRTASMALLNGGTAPMSIPTGGGASNNHTSNPRSQAQERWGEMLDSSPAGDAYVRRQYVPVEMDTILPLDLQPPTLTRMYNRYNSSDHLIDRFGFIYDQRRKKRQREAALMARQVKQGSGRHSRVMSISHNRRTNRSAPELFLGGPGDVEDEDDVGTLSDSQDNNGDAADRKSIGSGSGSNGASRSNSRPSSLAESIGRPANATTDDAKEGTPKRWQDYLKIATFPTELLAHTPAMSDAQIEVIADDVSPKSPGLMTPNRRGFAPPLSGPITAATTSSSTTTATGTNGGLDTDSIASGTAEVAVDNVSFSDQQQSQTVQDVSPPPLKKKDSTVTLVKEDVEPVRLLLQQLGDLHDTLQKERTVRWNEFLRKVRAERKREGDAIAAAAAAAATAATMATATTGEPRFLRATAIMPETRIADGEIIGVAGLGNKGKLGRAKWSEFRSLILGGIPLVLRAKVWAECTGAASLRVPGAYDDLVAAVARSSQARAGHSPGLSGDKTETGSSANHAAAETEADVAAQVEADIYRTLTDNIFFREGPGTAKLKEVLLAYAQRNPEVGYCQGMNLIAANLLLVTPSAEDAFWLLASIIETILPAGYYDHSLAASRADQQVLRRYVAEVLPRLSAHFDALAIDLETMTFQWFLSVFTDCLSAEALFRVWDVVFCLGDGSVFLFQVALALLKLNEAALLRCTAPAAVYTYINHQMTNHAISIDGLIQASEALRKLVRREDVEARRAAALDADRALVAARAAAVAEAKASRKQKAEKAAAAQVAAVKVV